MKYRFNMPKADKPAQIYFALKLWAQIKKAAVRNHLTFSGWVRMACINQLKLEKDKNATRTNASWKRLIYRFV